MRRVQRRFRVEQQQEESQLRLISPELPPSRVARREVVCGPEADRERPRREGISVRRTRYRVLRGMYEKALARSRFGRLRWPIRLRDPRHTGVDQLESHRRGSERLSADDPSGLPVRSYWPPEARPLHRHHPMMRDQRSTGAGQPFQSTEIRLAE